MNLLVYEHVSGGGFAGEPIPTGILCEGFAMLRTLICDLEAAGHAVIVPLDSRLKPLAALLKAKKTVQVKTRRELLKTLRRVAEASEAAYIIAPESDNTLTSLVEAVEESGVLSLNCAAEAIKTLADKAETHRILKKACLSVPETVEASINEDPAWIGQVAKDLGFPLVFKPINGVGCTGLSLIKTIGQIAGAIQKLKHATACENFLIQKFIRGVNASVSLIAAGGGAAALSLNMQRVRLASPDGESSYEGGMVPLEHPLKNEAFRAAEKAAGIFRGLRGYVGVDLVLAEDKAYIIEVNPRLTTSYIGLRRVVRCNPAQAIIDAAADGRLPGVSPASGFAAFMKVKASKPSRRALRSICLMENVLTPPLGIDDPAYAFIEAYGASPRSAWSRLYRVKKRLAEHIHYG